MAAAVRAEQFTSKYRGVFDGDARWRGLPAPTGQRFSWDDDSTYVRNPPFFENLAPAPAAPVNIIEGRVLALLGDSVTTTTSHRRARSPPTGRPGGIWCRLGWTRRTLTRSGAGAATTR